MGYVSEVRCIIYGEPDDMLRFVTAQKLIKGDMFAELEPFLSEYKVDSGEDGTAVLDLNIRIGVKWYDDWFVVQDWMDMLYALDVREDADEKGGIQYEFIRVGEESNDIETRYSSMTEGWIYARTVIDADLPHRVKEVTSDETSEG